MGEPYLYQFLVVLELEGGLVVILALPAVPDGHHDVAILALSLLLGPLTREGPEGRLQLAGRRHGLVVVATNRDEVSSVSFLIENILDAGTNIYVLFW